MIAASIFSTLFLALAVWADAFKFPISTLTKRHTAPGSRSGIVRRDQLRLRHIMSRGVAMSTSQLIWSDETLFVGSFGLGSPPTNYYFAIDTGSANTWIGANQPYKTTKTSVKTNNTMAVSYGKGNFSGQEWLDQVDINGFVVQNQSIGVANLDSNIIKMVDGIFGLGPKILTERTLFPAVNSTVNTIMDNLFLQGTIPEEVFGISFEPTTTNSSVNVIGQIDFGKTDSTRYNGDIKFTNVTTTFPSRDFYGVNMSVTYGENTTILPNSAGIVDTGTTMILLCTEAYNKYQNATGGVVDSTTGLLVLTSEKYKNLKSLFFHINGIPDPFELTANAQIWPRSGNIAPFGTPGIIYLVVVDSGSKAGTGLDFVVGLRFLMRFYNAFRVSNSVYQVGLATTNLTKAVIN